MGKKGGLLLGGKPPRPPNYWGKDPPDPLTTYNSSRNREAAQPRQGGLPPRGCTTRPSGEKNTTTYYWAPQGPRVNPAALRAAVLVAPQILDFLFYYWGGSAPPQTPPAIQVTWPMWANNLVLLGAQPPNPLYWGPQGPKVNRRALKARLGSRA